MIILAIIAFTRGRSSGGAVLLDEDAVNDLLAAVSSNSGSGRIPEIAASVSDILKKHLHCEKILFLRYYRSNLEVNYFSGLRDFNKNELRLTLKPPLLEKLKSFKRVTPIRDLRSLLTDKYEISPFMTGLPDVTILWRLVGFGHERFANLAKKFSPINYSLIFSQRFNEQGCESRMVSVCTTGYARPEASRGKHYTCLLGRKAM